MEIDAPATAPPPDIEDDIDLVIAQTPSAAKVVELVRRYGRKYANGELNFAERGRAMTGSEIPAICGENRFETPSSIFFKKAFDVRSPDNPAMAHGRATEPIAIAKFKERTGAKVFYVGFMRHARYDFLGGTFDALAILPSGEGVMVEVKCPFSRSIGTTVPPYYIGQVQTYLAIAGLDRCMFVQYKPAFSTPKKGLHRPENLSITSVQMDPAYVSDRMPKLWTFWKKLCGFRRGVLPTAPAAASIIQCAWRRGAFHRADGGRGGDAIWWIAMILAMRRFRNARSELRGVREATEEEMEASPQRPPPPVQAIRRLDPAMLVVVPTTSDLGTDGFRGGRRASPPHAPMVGGIRLVVWVFCVE
jgi:putative phage-type endonuclease